jgi:BlaI family penicillinase repressor
MKKVIHITEAEWEVMAVVWERTPVAASTIVELVERRKQWTLATVRTLLRRLVNKGALKQESEGKRYIYTPLISMAECARRESESFLDRVLGRAPSEAILHLVKRADLSPPNHLSGGGADRADSVGAMAVEKTPGTRLALRTMAFAGYSLVDASPAAKFLQHI